MRRDATTASTPAHLRRAPSMLSLLPPSPPTPPRHGHRGHSYLSGADQVGTRLLQLLAHSRVLALKCLQGLLYLALRVKPAKRHPSLARDLSAHNTHSDPSCPSKRRRAKRKAGKAQEKKRSESAAELSSCGGMCGASLTCRVISCCAAWC